MNKLKVIIASLLTSIIALWGGSQVLGSGGQQVDGITTPASTSVEIARGSDNLTFGVYGASNIFQMINSASGAIGPMVYLGAQSVSPAVDDVLAQLVFRGKNSAAGDLSYGYIQGGIVSATSTSESGDVSFFAMSNGASQKFLEINGTMEADGANGVTALRRFHTTQGAAVTSTNDLTLGYDGNIFEVTGGTQINAIVADGWGLGAEVTLIFAATTTVKHATAGGANTFSLYLAGSTDFSATPGDVLTLILTGIGEDYAWREKSRTVI